MIFLSWKEAGLKMESFRLLFSIKSSLENNLIFNIKTDNGQAETLIPNSPQHSSGKNIQAKHGNKVRYLTHG